MTTIPKPLTSKKGAPPPLQETSRNLDTPSQDKTVQIATRCQFQKRKQYKDYANEHDTTIQELILAALDEYIERNP